MSMTRPPPAPPPVEIEARNPRRPMSASRALDDLLGLRSASPAQMSDMTAAPCHRCSNPNSGVLVGDDALQLLASTIRGDLEQHQLVVKELVDLVRSDVLRHTEEVKSPVSSAKADLSAQITELKTSLTEQVKSTGQAVNVNVKKEMSRVMNSQLRYVSNELSNYKPSK